MEGDLNPARQHEVPPVVSQTRTTWAMDRGLRVAFDADGSSFFRLRVVRIDVSETAALNSQSIY